MGKGFALLIGTLAALSFAPIWRGAGHSRFDGVSFWQLLKDSTETLKESPFGHPHIPYEEAVHRAQEAYQEYYERQYD